MSLLEDLIGQTIDSKYKIEKLLGQGGMGAVYLATHVGTRRPVALKVIAPQFMTSPEFVERFRREAEAAGRLRHPNVVDVTDFGFAEAFNERLAYLVMEYLDGCNLGDVLKEEHRLSLNWIVEVLEQACLAVERAHNLGIIHRDLKPDNIWLEPNERGGYTVKVLDFGLAKLADPSVLSSTEMPASAPSLSINAQAVDAPQADDEFMEAATYAQPSSSATPSLAADETRRTANDERRTTDGDEEETGIQPPRSDSSTHDAQLDDDEEMTAVQQPKGRSTDPGAAKHTASSGALTQVGAILGTPLYMSPEQCMGVSLDARSDIYSLGVIAYEMLTGQPLFTGGMNFVMSQHITKAPPPLKEKRSDIPEAVSELVMSALQKDPAARPSSAAAFAGALRARSGGAGEILRRAFGLYSEHFSTFFKISVIAYIPSILLHVSAVLHAALVKLMPGSLIMGAVLGFIFIAALLSMAFAQAVNSGAFVPIVAQLLIAPLRTVEIRPAFAALKKRLRAFVPLALLMSLVQFAMIMAAAFAAVFIWLISKQIAPNPSAFFSSPKRVLIVSLLVLVPLAILAATFKAFINYYLYAPVVVMEGIKGRAVLRRSKELAKRSKKAVRIIVFMYLGSIILQAVFSSLYNTLIVTPAGLISGTLLSAIQHLASGLFFVLINPIFAVSLALLYFKTRQTDGELLKEALSKYEQETLPMSKWQMRMSDRRLSILESLKSNAN